MNFTLQGNRQITVIKLDQAISVHFLELCPTNSFAVVKEGEGAVVQNTWDELFFDCNPPYILFVVHNIEGDSYTKQTALEYFLKLDRVF